MTVFSVIIPTYNSHKTILRALKSVVNQSFNDLEIIIVDDGSTDNTKEIIDSFFKDLKVKYTYIYQSNSGPSSARNKAIANSTGKYIAFLDSDDEWHIDKLKIQYNILCYYNVKFISTQYTIRDFQKQDDYNLKHYSFNDFLISNIAATPCTIIDKELFDKVGGFDEQLFYSEDYNLWLKISREEPLLFIDLPLTRLHKLPYGESGLSSNMWEMEKGELYNYKYCYNLKYISFLKYHFLNIFSFLKYLKRLSLK